MAFSVPFRVRPPGGRAAGQSAVSTFIPFFLLVSLGAGALAQQAPPPDNGANGPSLPTVVVEASRPAQPKPEGSLDSISSTPIATTPLAVDVISTGELLDRGVNSLSSAIRTDPSVGDNYNTFGYIEALQIRGFTLDEFLNYQRDGMNVSSHVPIALENKESIEILKGTSGMLTGSSSPGGIVNYVLKQPTDHTLVELDSTVSERGSVLLHGDFGGRFGPANQFGYRINVAAEDRHPEIQDAWSKRALASGFFDWRFDADTLLQAEFEHQKVRETSVPGYGLLDATGTGVANVLPPPINPWINLNSQPWSQPFESTETSASVRLHRKITSDWDLTVKLATQRSVANDRVAFPDGCSYFNSALNANTGYYLYNGMCGNYNVDLYQYVSDDEVRNTNTTDTHVHGHIALLGSDNEVTAGLRTTRYSERYPPLQVYDLTSPPGTPGCPASTTPFNVYAQTATPACPSPNTLNAPLDSDLDELYAFDVAHFAQAWSAWFGARFTRITQDSSLTDGSEATALQQHLITPWLGLGYEPWKGGFAYASAGSGVEVNNVPNHEATLFTGQGVQFLNRGQVLPAQRSHQVELGFKEHPDAAWSFETALFRIEKPFPDNIPVTVDSTGVEHALQVAGARVERHQGIEIESKWQALDSVLLVANVTAIDAKTIQAVDPSWVGKAATNVAPLAASLQDTWSPEFLPRFSWSNIWTYAGHKAVLPDGSVDLPNYWQWDTNARYAMTAQGLHWTWRAGIDNVTNRTYWREAPMATWGSIYLFPAAGRTGRISVAVDW
jgi:iron complex outermembrane receptor protein